MIVMPANSTGWFWHCLARETSRIGHLYSPGAQRGPWPWIPYALDNGVFACWNPVDNSFDEQRWKVIEPQWRELLAWASGNWQQKPLWAIVPDRPGCRYGTLQRWPIYAPLVQGLEIPLAIAVQNGMTADDIRSLKPLPDVIAIGGTTKWKWETLHHWTQHFPRVHVLRCNSPEKLQLLESLGVESCDGTGWQRGDLRQTSGLEEWARLNPTPIASPLWTSIRLQTDDLFVAAARSRIKEEEI